MIQSDYALSYNVKNSAIKILKPLCLYPDWPTLIRFMSWFNKIIENRGRVMMSDICDMVKAPSIEAYSRIGFNSLLGEDNVYEIARPDGSSAYRLLFPVLKDFTLPPVKGDR